MPVEKHRHDGIDNEKINPKDLRGFPIILNAVPTYTAEEGSICLYWNTSTNDYRLYARINNGWRQI